MKIAILIYEEAWLVLVATALIKGLKTKYGNCEISFYVDAASYSMLQYNKDIHVFSGYVTENSNAYDLVINYSNSLEASNFADSICKNQILGFREKNNILYPTNQNVDVFYDVMIGSKKSDKNILQLLYKFADLTWRGEGYNINYFPRKKKNKHKTGVAVSNDLLKNFIINNLHLQLSELHSVPIKEDTFKKIDEINRCQNIITDDLFVLHAAIAYRKNVQFLDFYNLTYNIEFFGNGKHYRFTELLSENKIQTNIAR